jgi:hypothetical protein
MLAVGSTFLFGNDDALHLHVIIAGPTPQREVVLASITTLRPSTFDRLLILKAGDHPFIKHDSAVACAYAQIVRLPDIQLRLDERAIKLKEPMDAALVKRIRDALIESDFTPNGVRAVLRELSA